MIFFHGTLEENLKNIKKQGLLDATQDKWIMEVTGRKVCCVSAQPTSGEGGNPSYFAYGDIRSRNQDGYLVVMDIPRADLPDKIIAVFDNKVLDEYVQLHFFIRQEFRAVGYELAGKMKEYKESKDIYFERLSDVISKRPGLPQDRFLTAPDDQRHYYKKLRRDERYMYSILGLEVTDEFFDFTHNMGRWQGFYDFLQLHFDGKSREQLENFGPYDHGQYWREFYRQFPLPISRPNQQHLANWFSPEWLWARRLTEVTDNSQIFMDRVDPRYLLGFLKITTPSGFAVPFRSCRSKSGFSKKVWQEVHRLLKEHPMR